MTISVPVHRKRSELSRALAAVLALSLAGVSGAYAQEADEDPEETTTSSTSANDPATLDRVTVTGSRIKRAEIEGPAPITVISRVDMEREGHQTVFDALQTLTQNSTDVQGEMFTSGFTPNASVINLRGIGPGYTLFLINGRRMAEYPQPYNSQSNFTNAAAIPSAMIERIEVLAGGASAIYGSDAVAGVVNVVLRENIVGVRVIRAFNKERHEDQRLDEVFSDYAANAIKVNHLFVGLDSSSFFLMNIAEVAVLWVGGNRVGAHAMQIASISAMLEYALLILFFVMYGSDLGTAIVIGFMLMTALLLM